MQAGLSNHGLNGDKCTDYTEITFGAVSHVFSVDTMLWQLNSQPLPSWIGNQKKKKEFNILFFHIKNQNSCDLQLFLVSVTSRTVLLNWDNLLNQDIFGDPRVSRLRGYYFTK